MPSPFPIPLLPVALIALAISGIGMWIFNSISSQARVTHTKFALGQIIGILNAQENTSFPKRESELGALLKHAQIDWNSCSLSQGHIIDAWNTPVTAEYDKEKDAWIFHSGGKDGEFGTTDDIHAATRERSKGRIK